MFDASLVVLVRQVRWDEFQIEEVYLGDQVAGTSLRLPKLRLFTEQQYEPDEVEAITPTTRILLFLQPKYDQSRTDDQEWLHVPAYGDWQICDYGECLFWVHDPAKVADLRKMARDAVSLRKAWETARQLPDPRRRVEALWPFVDEVWVRTELELKKAAPISGDFLAERFDRLGGRAWWVMSGAAEFGGKKLHDKVRKYLPTLQRRYERFLNGRDPKLNEDWNKVPREIQGIHGELYYGTRGLAAFKDRRDAPFLKELAAWATKYGFQQMREAAETGLANMPDK